MTAVAFDTLRFMRTLEAAGVPERHAEAVAEAVAVAVRDSTENADLVTRKDLQIELQPIKAELGALRQDVDAKLGGLRQDMDAKLGGLRQDMDAKLGGLRQDMAQLEQRMDAKLETLRMEMKADIARAQAELIKWCVGSIFAAAGIATALARLIH